MSRTNDRVAQLVHRRNAADGMGLAGSQAGDDMPEPGDPEAARKMAVVVAVQRHWRGVRARRRLRQVVADARAKRHALARALCLRFAANSSAVQLHARAGMPQRGQLRVAVGHDSVSWSRTRTGRPPMAYGARACAMQALRHCDI